jgi:Family of unknown function (DUF6184)
MTAHQCLASAVFGVLVVTAACGSNPPPPSNAGVTNAQRVDTTSAVSRIVDAKCRHSQECGEIGGSRQYASRDACMSDNRGKAENDLRASNCPRGIDSTRLEACLSQITTEACTGLGSGFNRSMACGTGELCP